MSVFLARCKRLFFRLAGLFRKLLTPDHVAVLMFLAALIAAALLILRPHIADAQKEQSVPKEQGVFVPILMYHSILKDSAQQGEFVLSPDVLEQDLAYLKNNGYTTVFISDLVAYVNEGAELPEKPVVITFDDGSYNNLVYALALLDKYDSRAAFSIVGSYTAKEAGEKTRSTAYSYMNYADVKALADSGRAEICNHSYAMHELGARRGTLKNSNESDAAYESALLDDIMKNQALLTENCGITPTVYTYPYGLICKESIRLVRGAGFSASLGVSETPNYLVRGSADCLYEMGRYNRPAGISTEEFMKKALKG